MPPAVTAAMAGTMAMPVAASPLKSVTIMFIGLSSMMTRLIMRNINFVVPSILYKIDGSVASVVLSAMFAPFFLMSGRHVQINGLMHNVDRSPIDDHRARINDFRARVVSDINSAVKTRLTYTHGDTDIGGLS